MPKYKKKVAILFYANTSLQTYISAWQTSDCNSVCYIVLKNAFGNKMELLIGISAQTSCFFVLHKLTLITVLIYIEVYTTCLINVVSMLGQRLRRWSNIRTTLGIALLLAV